jgi:hypothetical protein
MQGRRAAHGLVIVVAVLFIGASTIQIVRAVFGLGETVAPDDPCTAGVNRLTMAFATAPVWSDRGPARDTEAVARLCAASGIGLDTWAAFERLQLAKEELARRSRDDVESPWHDVAPPLPVDLR